MDEDDAEYGILASIKERLHESNVPVWGDGHNEDFDPARAATAIEQFSVDPVDGGPLMNQLNSGVEQRFSDWQRGLTTKGRTIPASVAERQKELHRVVSEGQLAFAEYLRGS